MALRMVSRFMVMELCSFQRYRNFSKQFQILHSRDRLGGNIRAAVSRTLNESLAINHELSQVPFVTVPEPENNTDRVTPGR